MNNLKRVLSLALSGIMLVGMMAVSAGAADIQDFTDSDEIQHSEAVSTMVALNIINGNDDGSFDPARVVTRAEMAKMITVALNGGTDPVLGTKVTPTFTDIKGNWAEKYIEYCTSLKIISGRGDGTFDPAGAVTGTEAAKMMLTAMGYDATVYKFTGADWAMNVNTEANNAGLYEELKSVDPNVGMSRDDAAQLIYNGILAPGKKINPTLEIKDGNVTYIYENGPSIFVDKYKGTDVEGVMDGYSYDADKAEWTYSIDGVGRGQVLTDDLTHLFGMNVRVLFKVNNGKVTTYGIFAQDSSVLAEGYAGDLPDTATADGSKDTIKLNGTNVKLDATRATTPVYDQNQWGIGTTKVADLGENDTNYMIRAIDNDGDAKADVFVKVPFTVAKVTYVGTSSLTADNGVGAKDFKDIEIYEDAKKDDRIMVVSGSYSATEKPTYTKLDITSGTVTGKRVSSGEWLLDGDWVTDLSGTSFDVNDELDYIVLGSKIYYAKVTSEETGSRALGMIYDIGYTTSNNGVNSEKLEAKMIFADGNKATVYIAKINGTSVKYNSGTLDDVTTDTFSGTAVNGASITGKTIEATVIGELVNYKVNNDGEYEVKVLTDGTAAYNAPAGSDILGYSGVTKTADYTYSTNSIDGVELADDAVVFAFTGAAAHTAARGNSAKVYTGKELKNTGANYGSTYQTFGNAVFGKKSGFTYAQVVALGATVNPDVKSGANYGYLTSDAYTTYDKTAKKDYVNFTFWNGSEEVSAKAEGTDIAGFEAGAIITYDVDSGDVIKNVMVPLALTTGKVQGWDNNKKIQLGGNRELDDDTVILYINSKDKKGVQGDRGIIAEAADVNADGVVENNVRYIPTGTGKVALLVVDVNNDMKAAPAVVVSSVSDATTALTNNGSATYDGNLTASDAATLLTSVTAGRTLNVNGDMVAPSSATTLAGKLTVTGTLTLDGSVALTVDNKASLKVAALSGTATKLVANSGATIEVTGEATTFISILEDTAVMKNGVTVILGSPATGAANTWYSAPGAPATEAGNDGTAGTQATSVAAGTYSCSTDNVYTDTNSTKATKWLLQK